MFNWDNHYKYGGKSSDSDYHAAREWKQSILLKYYRQNIDTIIDVGCGDLQLWEGLTPASGKYTGIDISPTIIDAHKKMYPDRNFICANSGTPLNISADIVTCFDVLWHIVDENTYVNTLKNIQYYAKKYALIYTWYRNPLRFPFGLYAMAVQSKKNRKLFFDRTFTTDGSYQKYREFLEYANPIFNPNFELIAQYTDKQFKYGMMYVFRHK